jgi:coenzyme F420-0:L-glutamate ligase/coenzyme F420-1:gamma-L-glutamate ligase
MINGALVGAPGWVCHDASVMLSILPISGIPDVKPGDDLAELITTAAPWLVDGDVLVVTSKIVSKAEGNLARVPRELGPERDAAKASVLASETARVVATRGPTRIVATHHGFVMAAGGIDESNVDQEHLVLLPKDPDASARSLRADLRTRFGLDVVIVVSDTMGRPWRIGLTDVALGLAGLDPVRDYRGEHDAYGNELQITQMSPADELCGAAELVKGKADQVPVAVVRGLGIVGTPDGPGASALVRPADTDMFSLGTAEARADGLRLASRLDHAKTLPAPGIDLAMAADQAIATADGGLIWKRSGATLIPTFAGDPTPAGIARAGAAIHALRCALAAEGFHTWWLDRDGAALGVVEVSTGTASTGTASTGTASTGVVSTGTASTGVVST